MYYFITYYCKVIDLYNTNLLSYRSHKSGSWVNWVSYAQGLSKLKSKHWQGAVISSEAFEVLFQAHTTFGRIQFLSYGTKIPVVLMVVSCLCMCVGGWLHLFEATSHSLPPRSLHNKAVCLFFFSKASRKISYLLQIASFKKGTVSFLAHLIESGLPRIIYLPFDYSEVNWCGTLITSTQSLYLSM